jgi:glycosyltransferase involved in cell wall biosynthesis
MASLIEKGQYDYVLTHFSEYLAPLWAPRLQRLKEKGVVFGSVLHDPERDYVVGPKFWHDWSVRQAFSFLNVVYVHSKQELASGTDAKTVLVPYGIHTFPKPAKDKAKVREELRLPADAKVLLAAGFIRDNKNLDLVIRAISEVPDLYLIIAGTEQAGGNKPVSHYQELAQELGCADRCRWLIRYVDAVERADLFAAADICVMTYSASFRSASASLSAAVNYRLPSIVSSAPGSMEAVIKQYGIGIWVKPDSVSAIADGLRRWLEAGIYPDWETYMRENSWAENARRVIESMTEARQFNEKLSA